MTSTYEAVRQQQTRARRRGPAADCSQVPADFSLEQYRRVDPFVVTTLVREFGEAAALRILNGKPRRESLPVAPADPSTIAPPGARAIPGAHGTARGEARMREVSG